MSSAPANRWVLATRGPPNAGGSSSGVSTRLAAGEEFKTLASASSAAPPFSSSDIPDYEATASSGPTFIPDPHKIEALLAACPLDVDRLVKMDVLPSHLHHLHELQLSDRSKLHLTIAPPPTVPLLRHERYALETEAMVLALLRPSGLPVAQVIRHEPTKRSIGAPFLLTTSLPGAQLSKVLVSRSAPAGPRRTAIEEEQKRLLTSISAHKAQTFGPVPTVAMGKGHETWGDAFRAMLSDAIRDAEDGFVHLPYNQISMAVERAQSVLDDVQEPRLVVPGLSKPASVLVEPINDGHYRVSGIVGFQSAFWGDAEMGKVIEGLPPGPASESHRVNAQMFTRGQRRQKLML